MELVNIQLMPIKIDEKQGELGLLHRAEQAQSQRSARPPLPVPHFLGQTSILEQGREKGSLSQGWGVGSDTLHAPSCPTEHKHKPELTLHLTLSVRSRQTGTRSLLRLKSQAITSLVETSMNGAGCQCGSHLLKLGYIFPNAEGHTQPQGDLGATHAILVQRAGLAQKLHNGSFIRGTFYPAGILMGGK